MRDFFKNLIEYKRSTAFKSFATVLIAFLILLATSNKSLYEKLFSSWFESCRIVIDTDFRTETINNNKKVSSAFVQLFAFGDVPPVVTLQFESVVPMTSVEMQHPAENNYLLHRHVTQFCPHAKTESEYCKTIEQETQLYPQIKWQLSNFSSNISAVFKVDFQLQEKPLNTETFKTYLVNSKELSVCRVEQANYLNFWVWWPTWLSVLVLLIIMTIIYWLILILKKNTENHSAESKLE